jgi:FlaA1/EpsC-like NDP-sugar epimerase/CheY-like chemotaxis protein
MFLLTSLPATLETPLKKKVRLVDFGMKCAGGLLAFPCRVKHAVAVGFDLLSALLTVWMAFSLRLEQLHRPEGLQWIPYLLAPALILPMFTYANLYRAILRHSGFAVFVRLVKTTGIYGALFFAVVLLLKLPQVPLSVALLQPMLFLIAAGGSRALVRFVYHNRGFNAMYNAKASTNRILIYGAGSAGAEIASSIRRISKFDLAGYLDDDPKLHGRTIHGLQVFSPDEAESLIGREGINNLLIAMPSASRARRNEIVQRFKNLPVRIQMLPGIEELADGKVSVADVREVKIEDLLGRDPLQVNHDRIKQSVAGRVVMVTGAGGSIGSELCRQLLAANPSVLLLLEQAEHNLYTIHNDLEQRRIRLGSVTRVLPLLCDVTDTVRLAEIFSVFNPEVIYHAAAYKHVPMVEHNPAEGLRNNVFGTRCVAEAAIRQGVSSFVLVSTDKAVRPTNIMGASKRLCEMILQAFAAEPGHATCFSMVRFGNVLGSSGSVVPLFRRQIKEGGPLSITHRDITRYFMSIPEASQLVIKAGTFATGGEVFLLDMGEPVKIIDLARRMVELSGLTVRDEAHPDGDIEIRVTGLRPGEKLYEELLIGNNPEPTLNPRIFKASEQFKPWAELEPELACMKEAIGRNDVEEIKMLLKRIIPEYQPSAETSDLVAMEKEIDVQHHACVTEPVGEHAKKEIHFRPPKPGVQTRNEKEGVSAFSRSVLFGNGHDLHRFGPGNSLFFPEKAMDSSSHTTNRTILVVEDDNVTSLILKASLKGDNITTRYAGSGLDAIELVNRHPEVSLVLMDIMMTEMDGLKATKLIKEIRPELPIIVQTSSTFQIDRNKAIEAGCNGFISKPIDKQELLEMMENLLSA